MAALADRPQRARSRPRVSLLRISRDRDGALRSPGRGWQEDGTLSRATGAWPPRRTCDPPTVFYSFQRRTSRHPNAPQIEGTGEIKLE